MSRGAMAVVGSWAATSRFFCGAPRRRAGSPSAPLPGGGGNSSEWFHRYGLLTVFIPALTPIVPLPLKVFVISAGALRAPFVKFLAVIVVARVIRYFGEVYLGIQLEAGRPGLSDSQRVDPGGHRVRLALAMGGLRDDAGHRHGASPLQWSEDPHSGCPNESRSWRTRRSWPR